ncbi:MAG: ATP-binding protein [Gemmatimonadota bacterium]
MESKQKTPFRRPQGSILARRLAEERRFLLALTGPRQVGKTTLAWQVAEESGLTARYASADEPTLRGSEWLEQQWEAARLAVRDASRPGAVLVLDEIQKMPGWSETVKRLWDEDTRTKCPLKVMLLGSAPLLVARGLTESLTGRFEVIHLPHWSFGEMRAAFGWTLERYLFCGGYPGAAPLADDPRRWSRYILDSIIETTISRDVLLLSRVDKPALLRRLFHLSCAYSGRILSYNKMLGQLEDAGNTTTLAHYLDLLAGAGMVTGLQKYSGAEVRRRASSPKLQVLNTALFTAPSGLAPEELRGDAELWGRLVESAVGAYLANAAVAGTCELFYWRERNREVDFVVRSWGRLTAIEVKSGRTRQARTGLREFAERFEPMRTLLVGGDGVPLEEFLSQPVEHWIRPGPRAGGNRKEASRRA